MVIIDFLIEKLCYYESIKIIFILYYKINLNSIYFIINIIYRRNYYVCLVIIYTYFFLNKRIFLYYYSIILRVLVIIFININIIFDIIISYYLKINNNY